MDLQAASISGIDYVSSSVHENSIGERLKRLTDANSIPNKGYATRIPGLNRTPYRWGEVPEYPFNSLTPSIYGAEYAHFPGVTALSATVSDTDTTIKDFFGSKGPAPSDTDNLTRSFSEWWESTLSTRTTSLIAPAIYDGFGLFPPKIVAVSVRRENVFQIFEERFDPQDPPRDGRMRPITPRGKAEKLFDGVVQGELLRPLGVVPEQAQASIVMLHTNRALALVEASSPRQPYTSLILVEVTKKFWPEDAFESLMGPNIAVSFQHPEIWDVLVASLFAYHWTRKHSLAVQDSQDKLRQETRRQSKTEGGDLAQRVDRVGELSGSFYQDYSEFVSHQRRVEDWPERVEVFVERTTPGDKPLPQPGSTETENREGVLKFLCSRVADLLKDTEEQYRSTSAAVDSTADDVQRKIEYRLNETNVRLSRIGILISGLIVFVSIVQVFPSESRNLFDYLVGLWPW